MEICHQRGTAWFIREMRDEMNTLLRAMLIVVPLWGSRLLLLVGAFRQSGLLLLVAGKLLQ
jgi:hypothetical protein